MFATDDPTYLPRRIAIFAVATILLSAGLLPQRVAAQCCQLSATRCVASDDFNFCERSGGDFFDNRSCGSGQLCVRSRSKVTTHSLRIRRPARIVWPHKPHVTLVPAFTATPTPSPTPRRAGCCELQRSGIDACGSQVQAFDCSRAGGVFVGDAACDTRTNRCADDAVLGCCQRGTRHDRQCSAPNRREDCPDSFVPDGHCNRASGLCSPPLPRCGNGIIENGEECESDDNCFQPTEGCTDQCVCAGAVEVLLRWTNPNDLNLSVVDPHGSLFVPRANANQQCHDTSNRPEEFIYFPPGRAPLGCYTVQVDYAQPCPEAGIVDTHLDIRLNVEGIKSTVHDVPGPREYSRTVTTFGVRASCQ